jgi:hypothetical protein
VIVVRGVGLERGLRGARCGARAVLVLEHERLIYADHLIAPVAAKNLDLIPARFSR